MVAVPQYAATTNATRAIYGHTLRLNLVKLRPTLCGVRHVHNDVPVTPVPDPQLGNYPQLPNESNQRRPALGWWDMQYRRNFGETASSHSSSDRIVNLLTSEDCSSSTSKTKPLICLVRMFRQSPQLSPFANLATRSLASSGFAPSSTMLNQIPPCCEGCIHMMV
jgi:hypothetical protein